MTIVKARFDGRVFVPEGPVNLPAGAVVRISVLEAEPPASEDKPLAALAELLEKFPSDPNWPPDAAAQHDHYLYGTPKRP